MERYDAIIIGFGKGGKTLAAKLGAQGKRVAMIEKDSGMYGGTCINVGCIPSKSLVRSSGIAALHPEKSFEEKAREYKAAIEEKRRLTAALRGKNFSKLDDMEHVTVYNGTASFISNTVVSVKTENETFSLEGEKIFINTGGTPVIPPIEGLVGNPYVYTSAELMDLDILPERLVIIGGGYIGLEFASMYSGFGTKVTILQDGETFLKREDRDMAEAIRSILEERGVEFRLGAKIQKVEAKEGYAETRILWEGAEMLLQSQAVLAAAGRKPNTEGLDAENAGVRRNARGAVIVDDELKTSAPNIWAMGDVTGGLQFTYVSLDDFRIIWSQMNGGDYTRADRKNVPYSVFITPSFSRVGLNEEEARAAGYQVKILKMPAAAIPKAQVLKNPKGLLKAVIDEKTNRILGAMLLCEESYEMINTVKLAMDLEADYRFLGKQIYTHPTMSEAFNDLFGQ
ncbi:FAD-dependent oxidoreductase [Qiania dongpingensis]|uniref:FAD-dependent oxidoreductase n=1 Tax=Qiania dongpingensis TaxID=2763669 RepID=A0A7G9G211_9FIRM|nr:FAD-dependent oxidoreductase [Qiania dongpingensis]QNM04843.1 FAD-dependent oxidoreductase [Qiania dongpingensis]